VAKQRSPNCPQIPFLEAASRARLIYAKEHTHPADKNVIAEDLGYTSISGASLSMIGALRQYGLLEASGEGLRISDAAVDFFELPDDSKGKKRAMLKMAFRPALFHELWKQYEGKPPSEANLRHTLIKKGFLPKTAEEVLRVYEENFKLIQNGEMEYNDDEDATLTTSQETSASAREQVKIEATTQGAGPSISTPVGKDEEGRAVFAHVRFDAALRKEFVAGLKKYLDYLETTLQ
jgi:hypothetical protein